MWFGEGQKQNQHYFGDLWVGYCGWVLGQVTDKKEKRNSTNADCHSSSRNIEKMNKIRKKIIKIQLRKDDEYILKHLLFMFKDGGFVLSGFHLTDCRERDRCETKVFNHQI